MTIYEARDSSLPFNMRLKIYKENDILDYAKNGEVRLGFDECFFIGKGETIAEALVNAEQQWREDNSGGNPFSRCFV